MAVEGAVSSALPCVITGTCTYYNYALEDYYYDTYDTSPAPLIDKYYFTHTKPDEFGKHRF